MREIICYGGEIAIVDDEDFPVVCRHSWVYTKGQKRPYVLTTLNTAEGSKKTIMLHNLIMGFARYVDHIDSNTMNNSKSNLRYATHQQNGWNTRKQKSRGGKPCTSIYKGVMALKNGQWQATMRYGNKLLRIGRYDTEIEAAKAYNEKVVELRGEFAYVNPIPRTSLI